jgi:gp16 family phage-associated protein
MARLASKLHDMKVARKRDTLTMPKTADRRKARFRAALALAGLTMEQWAEQNGITPSHLSHVLSGNRDSLTLIEKVDAFADKQLQAVA